MVKVTQRSDMIEHQPAQTSFQVADCDWPWNRDGKARDRRRAPESPRRLFLERRGPTGVHRPFM